MFFNITRRSASNANNQHVLETLILPSLEESKSSDGNTKTRTASSPFTRKVTDWCKSSFKSVVPTSKQIVNPTPTTLPICPCHPAALWDGITYAYTNADDAFAAEEARRKITYDAPCQCSLSANVALKTPLFEEVKPETHVSSHLPLVHAQKHVIRTAVPRTEESNEIFITLPVVARIGSNAPLRIAFLIIPRITYKAPLLITYPHNISILTSPLGFTSAKHVGFARLPRLRLEPVNAVRSITASSVMDSLVLPLVFDADLWVPINFTGAEAAGLGTSSTPLPEWFIDMTQPCMPTNSDSWRRFDILPLAWPPVFIGMPWILWSSVALSHTTSSPLSSLTFSPTSTSNISRLSNEDLFTKSALSSPTTTILDDEESHEKNYSPDIDDSIQSSPWKITKKTPGTVASEGGWTLNPHPLAVPDVLVTLFPEDHINTTFSDTSPVECKVDEEAADNLEGWFDMGSIPDEVDQDEAVAILPEGRDDTDFQTSLEGFYMDEGAEEDFESWSEMGSIPDESDMDEVTAAPSPIHRSGSAPTSLNSSLYFIPSNTSSQCDDSPNPAVITFSPAITFDDDPKDDGWLFELEIPDEDLPPKLMEGMQSFTDFVLAGLVEDEGDIFHDSDASLVEPEATEDTSDLPDPGAPLDPTESGWATGWPKHVLEDLEIITRFVLAGLKPGESLGFDVSDVLPELKHGIAPPMNVNIRDASPILVNTNVEPVTTRSPPSRSAGIPTCKTPPSKPTRLYDNVSRGHSMQDKADRRAKHSSFLSSKLALLTEKGLG
ncbi:hypothetical protein FRB96_006991 [Tulasnella sp. 330]|nr:hypothetical protein FRB96_006991 [Tulasnella sp. 330]KAG8883800.1 hypothetical protein FRB97_005803 [Tulasnella sp. 331]